jgi:YHS domain-containing protein
MSRTRTRPISPIALMTLALIAALFLSKFAVAGVIYTKGGAAIDGTDPVAYFTQGRAVAGRSAHTLDWNGATWRFANAENRATFKAAPEKYAPQYGGYCAWAVSQGYSAPVDRDAWKIVGGKLYLNYSKGVQRKWLKNVPGNIADGDVNWPTVRAELAK